MEKTWKHITLDLALSLRVFPVYSSVKACGSEMTGSHSQHSLLGHLHPWLVPPVQQSIGRSWHTSQLFLFTCCQYSFNNFIIISMCFVFFPVPFTMLCYVSSCFCRLTICYLLRIYSVCPYMYWILRFVHLKGLLPLCSRALVRRTSNNVWKSECLYFHLHLGTWMVILKRVWMSALQCDPVPIAAYCLQLSNLSTNSCENSLHLEQPDNKISLLVISMQFYTFKKQIHVQCVTLHKFFVHVLCIILVPDR